MAAFKVFDSIEENDVKKMLSCFEAKRIHFKKDTTILSNIANNTQVGIIESGSAIVIRYNYNGSRTIIEKLTEGDTFGSFSQSFTEELYVISEEETDVILFNSDKMIKRCKKNCEYHNQIINNMLQVISQKMQNYNERIEVLTKKTIRDKLLAYFNILNKKQITKNIVLPFNLTDLADYLSIDRSAMMRELKNLKEEGLIESKGKKILLKY
ncbi:MAG: Crp/Fnr family transcriptional regulator [Erysipelotrichales bacterium]|nr:Crp/Fnr family transcriptional regulator [Erysipelotrichales bacterium]